jgi:hypothetical protein
VGWIPILRYRILLREQVCFISRTSCGSSPPYATYLHGPTAGAGRIPTKSASSVQFRVGLLKRRTVIYVNMQPYVHKKFFTVSCKCSDCRWFHRPKRSRYLKKAARRLAKKQISASVAELVDALA